jgi:drug/metabolite transporter (DMT)-like permease
MATPRPDRITMAAFAGVVLIGSLNIVAVRISNRELDPFWGASARFMMAAAVMFGLTLARRLSLPRGRSLTGALIYGALAFGLAYALFYRGAVAVPAGIAGVVMGSVPLVTVLLASAQRVEPFSLRALAGAIISGVGIIVIIAEPPGGSLAIGALLAILGAAAASAQSGIVVKRIPGSHPVTTNAVAMATGATLLLALSFAAGEAHTAPDSTSVWVALLYLGLIGSPVLFILYVTVLQRWTVTGASYQFVLFPPTTILLGAAIVDEPLTLALLVGTPIVLAGIYVGALARHTNPEPSGKASPDGSFEPV